MMASLMAAMCHDLDHPGNAYILKFWVSHTPNILHWEGLAPKVHTVAMEGLACTQCTVAMEGLACTQCTVAMEGLACTQCTVAVEGLPGTLLWKLWVGHMLGFSVVTSVHL